MKRILVTGGSGFIGGAIARKLISQGHEVIVTGTQSERVPDGSTLLPLHLSGLDWQSIKDIDVCFHQAAINDTTFQDRRQMMMANCSASKKLFKKLLKTGCKQFVYASSTAVYGNSAAPYKEEKTDAKPLNIYAESKLKLEAFAHKFGVDNNVNVVGLRYCNVYGPGEDHKGKRMSMIGQIGRTLSKGKAPSLFYPGTHKRDWIYIDDVVDANIAASELNAVDEFNCGSGNATSFNDIVKIISDELKLKITPNYIENPYKNAYQSYTECDMTKAKNVLGFEPSFDIIKGINKYIEHGFK